METKGENFFFAIFDVVICRRARVLIHVFLSLCKVEGVEEDEVPQMERAEETNAQQRERQEQESQRGESLLSAYIVHISECFPLHL